MRTSDLLAAPPAPDRTWSVLLRVGTMLDADRCFLWRGTYHFPLGDGWYLGLTPESAGRFRIAACKRMRAVVPFWTSAHDDERIARIVLGLVGGVREAV